MTHDATTAALLAQLDEEQSRLGAMLAGTDEAAMATRPPSGKWSVRENVRHLVFAELAHHSHILPCGREWRAMVLPPHDLPIQLRQKMVGGGTTTVAEALEVWQPLHAGIRAALTQERTAEAQYRLGRHIKHLQQHVDEVQRLLRAQSRAAKPAP